MGLASENATETSAKRRWRGFVGVFGIRRSRNVIYAFAIFAALALAGWRSYSLYLEHERLLNDAKATAAQAAHSAVTSLERSLDVADLLGEDVRTHIADSGGLAAIQMPDLQRYVAARARATSMSDYLMVVDATGRPLVLSEKTNPPTVNFSDRAWFQAHAKGGADSYTGTALRSRLGRSVIYTDSKRLTQNGMFAGAVDVAIEASEIRGPEQRRPSDPIIQLWTADRRFLFSNYMQFDSRGDPIMQSFPFAIMPSTQAGFIHARGSDVITMYRKAAVRPLVATATIRISEVLAPWDAQIAGSVALFVIAVLVGGLLAKLAADLADSDLNARWVLESHAEALRAAIGQRDLVVKEIHHRVKNSLQLTSSLMQIQAREFDNPEVRAAFRQTQQRLFAIGMIHDVLYRDDSKSAIEMRGYLDRLCSEIARVNDADKRGIQTNLDVDAIELMPEQATPLGLCIVEVLMHFFADAFLPDQSGAVNVRLKRKSEEIELTIANNGQGYSGPDESNSSLAMRLIKTLASQLHATYGFSDGIGTVFRLSFHPAPVIVRPSIPV